MEQCFFRVQLPVTIEHLRESSGGIRMNLERPVARITQHLEEIPRVRGEVALRETLKGTANLASASCRNHCEFSSGSSVIRFRRE